MHSRQQKGTVTEFSLTSNLAELSVPTSVAVAISRTHVALMQYYGDLEEGLAEAADRLPVQVHELNGNSFWKLFAPFSSMQSHEPFSTGRKTVVSPKHGLTCAPPPDRVAAGSRVSAALWQITRSLETAHVSKRP